MKFVKHITLFTLIAVGLPFTAQAYDKTALADDVKNLRTFRDKLSAKNNPANNDIISLITKKLESDHTSNEDIASMRMIVENNMLTSAEKANSLSNILSLKQGQQEKYLLGFIAAFFGLPLTTILLVAVKNGGF